MFANIDPLLSLGNLLYARLLPGGTRPVRYGGSKTDESMWTGQQSLLPNALAENFMESALICELSH